MDFNKLEDVAVEGIGLVLKSLSIGKNCKNRENVLDEEFYSYDIGRNKGEGTKNKEFVKVKNP